MVGPAFGSLEIKALGLSVVGYGVSYYQDGRTALHLTPDTGISGPAFGERRHHTAGPLKAKLAVCPLVQGHYEGFLFRRSWRSARPTGVFGTQWFARALASPRRVHRFDLEVFPKQTVLAPAPLSLAPTGAAGQKTARILDMNGGEPLFFKVLKGESISPFNIWKWQRVFFSALVKKFLKSTLTDVAARVQKQAKTKHAASLRPL